MQYLLLFVDIYSILVTPTHACYADQSRRHFFFWHALLKKELFLLFLLFLLIFCQYWLIFVRTYLLYGECREEEGRRAGWRARDWGREQGIYIYSLIHQNYSNMLVKIVEDEATCIVLFWVEGMFFAKRDSFPKTNIVVCE